MRIADGGRGLRLLDAGCGTGASTAALLEAAPHAEIVAIDASAGMLAEARTKSWPDTVEFVHSPRRGDRRRRGARPVRRHPGRLLLRNLADPDAQLRRFRELLRPGGTLAVHEYFGARFPCGQGDLECGGAGGSSSRRAGGRTHDSTPVPSPVAQREHLRRRQGLPAPARRSGFTGVHSETHARLAARDIVHHVLGGRTAMIDPRRVSHPAPAGAAACQRPAQHPARGGRRRR